MSGKNGSTIKNLKKINLLARLNESELEKLSTICKHVSINSGNVIMHEGEVGDSMFLFVDGVVDVTKNLTLKVGKKGFSKVEKSMVKLNSQHVSFFGDMAMFENDVRSATLTAATDCTLYEIKRDEFETLCGQYPELGYKIIREIAVILCERVRKGNQDVLKLTTALSIALSKG
ncbi:MAG: cyclic nucleotide-binding domain-containing protein [Spirochaetales bacterium]|nr:cyclic nucleotide-binding domain-containing protein [Spirochaetales bacterium]